ncbi:MAG: hypothetical protein H8E15_01330 [Planctomycetes bacterium]|nr:hypothetical protein [Planctomycetota bacterium]
MKLSRLLVSFAAVVALVGTTVACIEALDLNKMVSKTDACIRGTVTSVHTGTATVNDTTEPRIFTFVTIEGENLYTGKPETMEMAFMGGTHQGVSQTFTTMPAAADYRVGNKVVAFSSKVEGWGTVDRCLFAGYGGIYREIATPKGDVVLGRGQDFAIEKNMKISDLKVGISKAIEAKKESK